ncbi:endospore coat-associated protein [Paenibacillus agaridevorans]|uniref:Endospore coat-associated protein n=1 Tax=Paenibacillus agaridevorans TaxID=171404 RepID=A0A2R5EQA1_9BACL|nr:YheC/YheD family protein [Paenibacillus agaridevorans]GBG08862.1 endospore coat-associated protein [Paenibacillus agaridevorans]
MTQPVLGILTLYLNDAGSLEERRYYERMTTEGRKLGLHVFVFTPQDVSLSGDRIRGLFYHPGTGRWTRRWTGFPTLVFDRCRIQHSHRYDQLLKFRSRYDGLTYLNKPLRNKWQIHNLLSKDSRFGAYLPKTRYINSVNDVREMLRSHPLLYLKPINGTGGRGILRVERLKDGSLTVQGRDKNRRIVSPQRMSSDKLGSYLSKWNLKEVRYIAQQGLQLKLPSGCVHDYRLLVQKDGEGKWTVTGCAGRIGAPGSITANLHGGGRAAKMDGLLEQWITDAAKREAVKREVAEFGVGIASYLELVCGALCELAIDLAIDKSGRIWLIEVNPKPAREVFFRAGETEVYRQAIVKPLEYALWRFKQKKRKTASAAAAREAGDDADSSPVTPDPPHVDELPLLPEKPGKSAKKKRRRL